MFSSRADLDQAKAFHTKAREEKGVIVSTCNKNQSGCHDYSTSLNAQFPQLAMLKLNVNTEDDEVESVKIIQSNAKSDQRQFIVFTGCMGGDAAAILRMLKKSKSIANDFNHLYVLITPHQAGACDKDIVKFNLLLQYKLLNLGCRFNLLTSGIHCDACL
jgi:23S rRNA A1618 N6-methylase RlmF